MYKVTMKNTTAGNDGVTWEFEATDSVSAEHLDAYVADARTRWSVVDVTEEN